MTVFFYFKNDLEQWLYSAKETPVEIQSEIVELDSPGMLRLLEKRLLFYGVADLDWLSCPSKLDLAEDPVFYPLENGSVRFICEKSEIVQWHLKHYLIAQPNLLENVGLYDYEMPELCSLSQSAKLSDYKTPTPQQILDFVLASTNIEIEFFVMVYQEGKVYDFSETIPITIPCEESEVYDFPEIIPDAIPEKEAIRVSPPSQKKSGFSLFHFFCCIPDESEYLSDEEQNGLISQ